MGTFDEASFFHTWDWLDLQERALGLVFDRYLVELDGEPVGVVPALRSAPATLYSPLLPNPFQGPLVPSDLVRPVTAALRRRQVRRALVVHRYEVGPPFADTLEAGATRHTSPPDRCGHRGGRPDGFPRR